jgi:nucleotidyltransferase substrate binding protein (TIGR01987 family)
LFTSEKADLSLKKFSRVLGRLEEAVTSLPSPLQFDAVLQRFEFTFELCWKALRINLSESLGIEVSSPKGTLKEAFRHGLIRDTEEKSSEQMLEDRNRSSHVYDEQEAVEIFNRVCSGHLPTSKNDTVSPHKVGFQFPGAIMTSRP